MPRAIDTIFLTKYHDLENLNKEKMINNAGDLKWNNINKEDVFNSYDQVIEKLVVISAEENLQRIPYNILSSLNSQVQALYTRATNLHSVENNQTHFNNFANQTEACLAYLINSGIYFLFSEFLDVEQLGKSLSNELTKIKKGRDDLASLEEQLKDLAARGVSGKLAIAFSRRRHFLFLTRVVIFVVLLCVGFFAFPYFKDLILEISTYFSDPNNNSKSLNSIIVRTVITFPMLFLIGFLFAQYNKERYLEETYAFRETVSSVLSIYQDLIKQDDVKDQVFSVLANKLFASPLYEIKPNKRLTRQDMELISELRKSIEPSIKNT